MESVLSKAIQSAQHSEISFCKFLAANDTKATNSHQSGYLIGKSAWKMFLNKEPVKGSNLKVDATIKWQDDFETNSVFTYYGAAKDEFRLTVFGKGFPFREEDNVGDLFIICKTGKQYYNAYILQNDEEIEEFFAALNISAVDTNTIILGQTQSSTGLTLMGCFGNYLKTLKVDFPTTYDLALNARNCFNSVNSITSAKIMSHPDQKILSWLEAEFQLFKAIENIRYSEIIKKPFSSVEDLIEIANTILNRRKSRAGKSLEHHLSNIFQTFGVRHETQAKTEDEKKPDFLFPGSVEYKSSKFSDKKLVMLAAKTTCKDRWRQILNEADRIKTKHLFTLQQGISSNQLKEMYKHNVCLVVPNQYHSSFPSEYRPKILTLKGFIQQVQALR